MSRHKSTGSGLQPPVLSWWEEREAAETRMPSDPETQPEAERSSDSYETRLEAANMYVKHMEMRVNSGAVEPGRQILNRVWA